MLTIGVIKQDKRGVCHGIVVFLWVFNVKLSFSNIFWKYTYKLLGETKETLDFQIEGSIFAYIENKCGHFFGANWGSWYRMKKWF